MGAASAVNSKGAFWFATYEGGLSCELFVTLLRKLMFNRKNAVHLVVDGLPAHKKAVVKDYVVSASRQGRSQASPLGQKSSAAMTHGAVKAFAENAAPTHP